MEHGTVNGETGVSWRRTYWVLQGMNQFKNIELISNRFYKAKTDFEAIKTKYYTKYVKAAAKQEIKPLSFKTYEEFTKK